MTDAVRETETFWDYFTKIRLYSTGLHAIVRIGKINIYPENAMKRFKHPFTLVELLCVIVVVMMLSAISIKVSQIVFRRSEDSKTQTAMEIIRAANEQYRAKKGYYLPTGSNPDCPAVPDTGFYKIKFCTERKVGDKIEREPTEFGELLGDAFDFFVAMPCEDDNNKEYLRDSWGKEIRYRYPGFYNTTSYDLYSKGRDKTSGEDESSTQGFAGLGDDIANFKNLKPAKATF